MAPRVLFVVVGVAAFVVACDKSGPSPAPAPSTMPDQSVTSSAPATADAPAVMAQSGVGRLEQRINMHDACDADSFNEAVRPGTCSRNGGVKFDQFINLVMKFHSVGPWNFAPNNLTGMLERHSLRSTRGERPTRSQRSRSSATEASPLR